MSLLQQIRVAEQPIPQDHKEAIIIDDNVNNIIDNQNKDYNDIDVHKDVSEEEEVDVDDNSSVSLISFDLSSFDVMDPIMSDQSNVNALHQNNNINVNAKTPIHSNRTARLINIHKEVMIIQKENERLKDENRRLMLQISTSNSKSDEEHAKRLDKIITKVQQVQQENDSLKKENIDLRLKQKNNVIKSEITTTTGTNIETSMKDLNTSSTDAMAPNPSPHRITFKENVDQKKQLRGRITPLKTSNQQQQSNGHTIEELTEKISILEKRLCVENIAELNSKSFDQQTKIRSLERQLKQSHSIIVNLENQLNSATHEIIEIQDDHNIEKEELQRAYDELKVETSSLIEWLKEQLSVYRGKSKYVNMTVVDDDSLESLTKSEREELEKEIEQEREKWKHLLDANEKYFDLSKLQRFPANENKSIGESTLSTHSSIESNILQPLL